MFGESSSDIPDEVKRVITGIYVLERGSISFVRGEGGKFAEGACTVCLLDLFRVHSAKLQGSSDTFYCGGLSEASE